MSMKEITLEAKIQNITEVTMFVDAELEALLMQRTERIVSAAAAHGADVLILGAFGCGVFLNPPETVAKAFAAAVSKYSRAFETVEFAVYTGSKTENYDAFRTIENIQEA